MRPFVCGWVSEWVRPCVRESIALCLVGRIQPAVLVPSLSNFTCKLCMMRRGTLFILGPCSKVEVNFGALCMKHCGHDTVCSFSPITFKLHM